MKKNFTVNINGIIFHIDDDAYHKLSNYLDSIRNHFEGEESQAEICNDIEARVAEMLQDRLSDTKKIVTITDVDEVIAEMGQPFEFSDEDEAGPGTRQDSSNRSSKRLYRDLDDKILGGVASGMGAYFNTDPLWFRLGFVVLTMIGGSGILLYILLWLVIPAALTTAEKLEMRGEPVNVSTIEKSIRDELNHLADKLKTIRSEGKSTFKKKVAESRSGFERLIDALINIARYAVKAFVILMGIAFVLVAVGFSIPFIASLVHPTGSFTAWGNGFSMVSLPEALDMIFIDSRDRVMAMAGLAFVIGVPLLMLLYHGIKLIFGLRFHSRAIGGAAFGVWLIGIILTAVSVAGIAYDFRSEGRTQEIISIESTSENTYYLTVDADVLDQHYAFGHIYFDPENPDGYLYQCPQFIIRKSETDEARVITYRYARGASRDVAESNSSTAVYPIEVSDSVIILPTHFFIPTDTKWRGQYLKVVLEVPVGTKVVASQEMEELTDYSDNWLNFPSQFAGHSWVMTQYDGLKAYE